MLFPEVNLLDAPSRDAAVRFARHSARAISPSVSFLQFLSVFSWRLVLRDLA
jgi:hypothetical protein